MSSPFKHEKRGSMSPQRRARIFDKCKGVCGWTEKGERKGCNRKLRPGDKWRVEHGDALELGGTDNDEDLGLSCEWCWPSKDASDHKQAGHLRRSYTKHFVPTQDAKSGRGFRKPPDGWDSFNRRWRDE